jgi:hypothetical protein
MKRICPNPMPWHEAFKRLTSYAQSHRCTPSSPPKPLILAGWAYSNDVQKMERWEETLEWADNNGCANLVAEIPEQDFYLVDIPTCYAVGPMGGPMLQGETVSVHEAPVSMMWPRQPRSSKGH